MEWLTALNKSQQNNGLMELEESVLEKALSYIENKVSSALEEYRCMQLLDTTDEMLLVLILVS